MNVAILRLEVLFVDCNTLREKRRRMQAITDKLRRHFNVSVAEADRHDRPSESVLVAAAVGATRREARDMLQRVADAMGAHPSARVLRHALSEV